VRPSKLSPNVSPAPSPARNLPGTLLPLTGQGTPVAPECEKPEATSSPPSFDLTALIPDHVDEDIFARYDFDEQELGTGGYGRVYLAKDRKMADRVVAVKKAVMLDGDMREGFQQEVRIMKELDHPNICRVYESYDHGRHVYLVMEYCAGGDLFDHILRQDGLSEAQAAEILRQVASALKHAHDKGVAHRDLKPENVCFCSEDVHDLRVKVIDWGLGFYFKLFRMSAAVGSGNYAAPEVQRPGGCVYTSSCDLWSLGAMACVLLSGEPPRASGEEIDFLPSGAVWDSISPDARSLVASLLRRQPSERPSAEEVLNHVWLKTHGAKLSLGSNTEVLANLRRFSNTSTFLSLCAASVAQQLSRHGLKELEEVFRQLDANADGILELHEVKAGFQQIFGKGSAPLEEIEEMFVRLDIDGSGAIDYTEFLAAGMGNRVNNEVEALWAAFKAFDVHESDGNLTEAEIAHVLFEAGGAARVWSFEKCEELAREVVQQFDRDGNGSLDFDEWVEMMKRCTSESPRRWHCPDDLRRVSL